MKKPLHGVDFEEAKTALEDPYAITISDDLHSDAEEHSVTLGLSLVGLQNSPKCFTVDDVTPRTRPRGYLDLAGDTFMR